MGHLQMGQGENEKRDKEKERGGNGRRERECKSEIDFSSWIVRVHTYKIIIRYSDHAGA